jgi:small subunit ribosomal protein S4
MARYRGPRLRIVRRLGELPGLTSKIPKSQNPPGQHGASAKKLSQYGIRLQEKQKVRYHYGLTESQLIRYVKQARRMKGSTGEIIIDLLEKRLDTTVFRLGYAPTIRAARQLVSHKHVLVNGGIVNIPSYTLRPGDVVSVREKSKALEAINEAVATTRVAKYTWLAFDSAAMSGTFLSMPDRADIPENIKEQLIVELYSK